VAGAERLPLIIRPVPIQEDPFQRSSWRRRDSWLTLLIGKTSGRPGAFHAPRKAQAVNNLLERLGGILGDLGKALGAIIEAKLHASV
jgi:hypothetical protein